MTEHASIHEWRSELRVRLRGAAVGAADLEDVVDELAAHLARAEYDLRISGASPEDARRRLLGDLDLPRLRDMIERRASRALPSPVAAGAGHDGDRAGGARMRAGERLGHAWNDLRFATRTLMRDPAVALFIVIVLALGIGANAAMFGVLDRLLLRGPLGVRAAHELRRVVSATQPVDRPGQRTGYLTYAQYEAFRRDTQTFAGVAAYNVLAGTMYGIRGDARPVRRGSATGGFFTLLGVQPALGRFFTDADDDPDRPQPVAVLGHRFWELEFGSDSGVLGRTIYLDYATYTVIGVAPRGFTGVDLARVDAWVPESGVPHSTGWRTIWYWPWLHVVVRLKPDVSDALARESLTQLHRNGYQGRSDVARNATITAEPLHYVSSSGVAGMYTRVGVWLYGLSGAVLLVACANVGNLLLARTARRRRELAIRLALGAGRFRIMRLLIFEALILCSAGGVAAVGFAAVLGAAARSLVPDVEWPAMPVDPRLLLVTVGLVALTATVVGLVPAVRASAAAPADALRSGVREGGGRAAWLRNALTVSQAALAAILVVAAGLFVQSFRRASTLDTGLETERLVAFRLDHLPLALRAQDSAAALREMERVTAFPAFAAEHFRAWPDVEAVSLSSNLPFVDADEHPIRLSDGAEIPALRGGGPYVAAVSREYFSTVRTPLFRGRDFTADDREGAPPVAVVSETTSRVLWPGLDAVGQCVIVLDDIGCARVIGVVADTKRSSLHDEPAIQVYVLREQHRIGADPFLIIRANGNVTRATERIRDELLRLDPSILYVYVERPRDEVDRQAQPWRLASVVFLVFGLLALAVATVGLYAVMSYVVAQRTQEIGVRMALGATSRDIARLVLASGLTRFALGAAAGLFLALLAGRRLAPLLFQTSPADLTVIGAALAVMAAAAGIAVLAPALRSARVDPMEAIRIE